MPITRGQLDYLSWLRASWLFDLFQRVQTHAKIGCCLGCECIDVKEVSILITPAKPPMFRGFGSRHMKYNTRSRIVAKLPRRVAKMLDEERRPFSVKLVCSDPDEPITHSSRA